MGADFNQLFIGSMAVIVLGYVLKEVIAYFVTSAKQRDEYLVKLVADNAKNVENFVNTINHNQTKMNTAIDRLADSISVQTDVFTHIVNEKIIPKKRR